MLRAGRRADRDAEAALAALCRLYWIPLYAYVRRRTADENEAQDLTQEFFARLLEKEALAHATPDRGRFRAFLLTAIKHFLANEWDRAKSQKRGGSVRHLSLDWRIENSPSFEEPTHEMSPERLYERQWALTLLDTVMDKLRKELVAAEKGEHFEVLKAALTGERERLPYAALGQELRLSEQAARQAAARLRKRYRELLRAEVAQTVADPGEVDDEIRSLFEVLGR